MKGYLEPVLFAAVLFLVMLVPLSAQYTEERTLSGGQFATSDTMSHGEIVITHNDNFTTQGWQGNGTVDNPFLISGLKIASNGVCINISNTDAYFVIEDCYLTSGSTAPSGCAISFQSVQNGEVRNVIMTRKAVGVDALDTSATLLSNATIYDSDLGICLKDSTGCSIVNSTITHSLGGSAITLDNSDHCDVIGNQLQGNKIGFLSNSSQWITLTNNTIVGNSNYGIQSTSGTKKLSVYLNRIGWNGENAIDNGSTKFWDNGKFGNWWSDGGNDTTYLIAGEANAKDRHSQVLTDSLGPEILTQFSQSRSDGFYTAFISAEVTDNIAVDNVILSFSLDTGTTWTNVTMDWSYSSWTASVDSLTAGSTIYYVVFASDYATNWEMTQNETQTITLDTDTVSTSPITGTNPSTNPTGTNGSINNGFGIEPLVIIAIVGAAAVGVVAIVMYRYPSKIGWGN